MPSGRRKGVTSFRDLTKSREASRENSPLLGLERFFPKCGGRRSVWGAYASSRVVFGVSPTEFSGGTPEIAREDACAPRTYPKPRPLSALFRK